MAKTAAPTPRSENAALSPEPLLEQGDRLSRDEFERRYELMPHLKKAELVEGTVYLTTTVRAMGHGLPHNQLSGWLGFYTAESSGVACGSNPTVRLDLDNEPQPDLCLLKLPEKGGQAQITPDDYIEGAPELAVEIVGSSRAYDLHQKKQAYRRNSVLEYLVWITGEQRIIWWFLREGEYQEIAPQEGGLLQSTVFPGLWLDTVALLKGDMKALLASLRRGLESPEHAAFLTLQKK